MKKDQEGPFQNQRELGKMGKRGTVSCTICQAVYTPSRQRSDLLQAAPLALESAFMSMCHFCFRCRRPACPECWDEVHNLCGECVREATLPFRTELPPLAGTLLPPARRKSVRAKRVLEPLIAIRPGSFAEPQVLPIDMITTRPERPKPPSVETSPASEHNEARVVKKVAGQNVRRKPKKQKPEPAKRPVTRSWKRVGKIVTWCLLGLVLGTLLLIVLALASSDVNAFIFTFLHIDVRLEIEYVLRVIGRLFS